MKISKKIVTTLCIIVPILALITGFILYTNQKPNFSKYHSYAVVTGNGDIPLTDEKFQRIVDVYKNDKTLYYDWFDEARSYGYEIKLYKSTDMSGEYYSMTTGGTDGLFLRIRRKTNNGYWKKAWEYFEKDTMIHVCSIIEEAIEQYESEQE